MGPKPKLTPLRDYAEGDYPKAKKGSSLRGMLMVSAMTATSLGGCGPALDSRAVDVAVDAGDLDGSVVNCDQTPEDPQCQDATASSSSGTGGSGGSTNQGGTAGSGAGK
jgi:hypothetical protein